MYCPSCGAENPDDKTFCSRCGTNLEVVSGILRGRYNALVEPDEKLVTLLKDVYRGRRAAAVGGLVSIVSLGKLAPIILFHLADVTAISILLVPFLIAGLITLVWGLTKWNNASSEIKAITQVAAAQVPSAAARQLQAEERASPDASHELTANEGLTAASVVEHTTAKLDERRPPPPLEPQRD